MERIVLSGRGWERSACRSRQADERYRFCRGSGNVDVESGVFFTAAGAVTLLLSTNYSFGSAARMGPGFFPIILSALLMLLGLAFLFSGLLVGSKHMHPASALKADGRQELVGDAEFVGETPSNEGPRTDNRISPKKTIKPMRNSVVLQALMNIVAESERLLRRGMGRQR
ncbi:hypothetical protein J2Y48_004660 [Mycoplana sp. BE70]|uniref:tripartite tricarboxylate transporter TctB family protein n=1 Tax=Mycoplana sp. BE70 TaxID=2817775 RepID=UPI0028556D8C|nr:tripartite tricarboxylate transporter TctB family protein [Mycoplana sp. BE70]MDR6759344.1 hypothetical protein [Mycoplana sp. BE70]